MTQPSTLRRLPDWPERLAELLQRQAAVPFAWGQHDCCRFAAAAVQALTGAEVLPVQWHTRHEAARMLRLRGGLVGAVDAVLPRLHSVWRALRGDIVLVQTPAPTGGTRQWLAVTDGARWWAPGPHGLTQGPMVQATRAWGVGHG